MKQKKLLLLLLAMLLPMMASADPVKIDGIYYNLVSKVKTAEVTSNPNKYSGDVVIPETVMYRGEEYNVTSIGEKAFQYCNSLTSVTIPNSVTTIDSYAFNYCSGLTSVTIPNSVFSIGSDAFQGCSGLTSVTIPNSVTSIGKGTFQGCSSLTSVTIPNSVTIIDDYAFSGCSGLTSITIPNSVMSIHYYAFSGCSGLTSITIPNSVMSIGAWAFSNCTGLTSITIPNSVMEIGNSAFNACSGVTSITIGSGVKTIYGPAFGDCPELTDVYCYSEKLTEYGEDGLYTNSNAFEGSYIEYATLHVPKGCSEAYKAKAPWKNFKSIVEMVDAKVKLNKTKATIEKGKTLTLKATITPTDLPDKSVIWKSSDTKIATVTSAGKVKGIKAGTATITCTSNSTGAKATCKVTVGYVKLDQTEATIMKGKTVTLAATVYPSSLTDKTVTWESSNTKVATVTTAGKVKGVKAGTATITCTSNATGLKATCAVNVVKGFVNLNKTEVCVQKGKTTTLKATVTPETLTDKSVTWESSDKSIATVTSAGKVKGVKYGTATITCTSVATGAKATCQVTVGKVIIGVSEITIKKSRETILVPTLYPSDLADKSVTWKSSDTKIATVTADGKVKGIKAGTATITCTSVATGLKGTCTVTVLSTSGARSIDGDDDETTGIEENVVAVEPFDVYDLSGHKVLNQVTSLDGLPKGIYIVNGRKVLKKE